MRSRSRGIYLFFSDSEEKREKPRRSKKKGNQKQEKRVLARICFERSETLNGRSNGCKHLMQHGQWSSREALRVF
jgi:hypothetical protein